MNSMENAYLGFYWQDRKQTLGEYLEFCSNLFEVIRSTIPQISDIALATENGNLAVRMPLGSRDATELGEKILSPKVKYDYEGNDSNITGVTSILGFTSTWVFGLDSGGSGVVTVSSGSYGDLSPGNSIVLKISDWTYLSRDELEKLMINIILCSQCNLATFTSKNLNKLIDPKFQYDFAVGWLSYLSMHKGLNLTKLPSGVNTQETANGLVLKVPKDNICSLEDEVVNELRSVQELLVDSGLVYTDDF